MQRTPSKSDTQDIVPPTPSQPATATPDYAAGLGAEYAPGPSLQTGVYPDRNEGLGEVGDVGVAQAKPVEERATVRNIIVIKVIQNVLESCYLVVQDPSPFAGQPYTPPAIPQSSHPPLTPLTPVTPLPPLTPGGEPSTPVAKQPTKGLRLSVSCVICVATLCLMAVMATPTLLSSAPATADCSRDVQGEPFPHSRTEDPHSWVYGWIQRYI